MSDELIRAFDVALIFDRPTRTVVGWARKGWLPGAVFVGSHVWFNRGAIEAFVKAGGFHPAPSERQRFQISRYGAREHAAGRLRNDRTCRPSDSKLADLVKPDAGVRSAEAGSGYFALEAETCLRPEPTLMRGWSLGGDPRVPGAVDGNGVSVDDAERRLRQ